MKVTNAIIQLILSRLGNPSLPKISKSDVAAQMGYGKAWTTKLLNGSIKNLTEEQVERLEKVLGVKLIRAVESGEKVPHAAIQVGHLMTQDPAFSKTVLALLEMREASEGQAIIPMVDTKKLPKLGAAITRIVHQWEEGEDPHFAKIAVETLNLLRDFYGKESKK